MDGFHLPTTLRKCPVCTEEWFEDEYDDRIITCPGCKKEFLAECTKVVREKEDK